MNTATTQQTGLRMSSDIIGRTVRNWENENLGTIDDLVIDSEEGNICFAIIGIGGGVGQLLGFGDRAVAVPWPAFEEDEDSRFGESPALVLNSTREQLETAPSFDRDKLEELNTREFADLIFAQYHIRYVV